MWFLFSLTAMLLGIAFLVRQRLGGFWNGDDASGYVDGQQFRYQIRRRYQKKRLLFIEGALECQCPYSFECRRERVFDRLFKWLGLSVEIQSGDPVFDREVYVLADHAVVSEVFRQHPALRAGLRDALQAGAQVLLCRNGRLMVRVQATGKGIEGYIETAGRLEKALFKLRPLVPLLQAVRREPLETLRDPVFWKAVVVSSLGIGLVMAGLAEGVRAMFSDGILLHPWKIVTPALPVVGLLWGSLLALALLLLRGTSRFHLVLVEVVLVGGLGSVMMGLGLARDYNSDVDQSVARHIQSPVTATWTEQRKRKRSRYTAYLFSVPPEVAAQLEGRESFEVSQKVYQAIQREQSVTITRRDGALGVAWVEHIQTP